MFVSVCVCVCMSLCGCECVWLRACFIEYPVSNAFGSSVWSQQMWWSKIKSDDAECAFCKGAFRTLCDSGTFVALKVKWGLRSKFNNTPHQTKVNVFVFGCFLWNIEEAPPLIPEAFHFRTEPKPLGSGTDGQTRSNSCKWNVTVKHFYLILASFFFAFICSHADSVNSFSIEI